MTNSEVMDKVHELLSKSHSDIIARAERLLHSGAVDVEDFDDGYILPKAIICIALRHSADSWLPHSDSGKALIDNLKRF